MDLNRLDTVAGSTRGAFLHLKHPNGRDLLYVTDDKGERVLDGEGKPQPYGLEICGIDDPHFARLRDRQAEEVARMRAEAGGLTTDRAREIDRALIAHAVKSTGNLHVDGKPVPFNHAAIVAVFARFPWVYNQVERAVGERARFVGNS